MVSVRSRANPDSRQRSFPDGFLWGTATSSHQVEGDNFHNDWWAWERANPSRIRGERLSGQSGQWWAGRAEHDLGLAVQLGHNAHRMSVEWSRIEPEPGKFSSAAVDRYRAIIGRGRDAGLSMYVTINHFTLPQWVAARGGWLASDTVERFGVYADQCARVFGDLVGGFMTINEPAVLAYKGYVQGLWPPGRRNVRDAARCVAQQLAGHAEAYHALKSAAPNIPVGLALNLPTVEPSRAGRWTDRVAARVQDWLVNGVLLEALKTGRTLPPLAVRLRPQRSLARAFDFIGVNYYGAYEVRLDRRLRPRFVQTPTVATESADWGKPSPAAFEAVLRRLGSFGVPILVSENGLYDLDDAQRPGYIVDHVTSVHRAVEAGVPVFGYLYWSLIDNFEWAQGWTTPFGLVALDLETQTRTPKASAYVFEKIARSNGVASLPR